MDSDPPPLEAEQPPADALNAFVSGSFSAAEAKLFGRSRAIPSDKDFHFFNNFNEFRAPVNEIKERTTSCLRSIADSGGLWGARKPPQFPDDLDDAYDWLVNLNDDFIERFSVSMDEFRNSREREEADGSAARAMEEDGFQMVYGKKKRDDVVGNVKNEGFSGLGSSTVVNVVIKDEKTTAGRSKVPFHIPSILRPQDEYTIRVNNENKPFDHVWLEKSPDGSRYSHPLEKLSVDDFIDRNIGEGDPMKPLPLENTPFKLVEAVNDLREMVAKLRLVNEFAVDLEHNHYRSFQGLTCLMQISTRTEDFVVDTLKLRIQVGPYLREIFKDPSKRKVMHGADRDIIWLQRDFGIYVCNLFDTGQASRVLQLERNSLEYLLHYYCGVTANKEYQNADWRLRPLPNEMVKYAREDTHYLLYIYDVMKSSLLSSPSNENDLLLEIYRRSAEICMQLYEKELLTDTSYLYIYGVLDTELNAEQLAVVAGLSQWRDSVARAEDESTGYILPNKTLIEIAKQMPLNPWKLKRLVKSKHPYVERNLRSVLGIIKSSMANSAAFQSAVQQLKKARLEASVLQNTGAVGDNTEPVDDVDVDPIEADPPPLDCSLRGTNIQVQSNEVAAINRVGEESEFKIIPVTEVGCSSGSSSMCKQVEGEHGSGSQGTERKATVASVQLLKKPSSTFGALFGNSASKRKIAPTTRISEQVKNEDKINQIKSSVALPFHYFSGENPTELHKKTDANVSLVENPQPRVADTTKLEEVIPLEQRNDETASPSSSTMEDGMKHREGLHPLPDAGSGQDFQPESDAAEEPMSPSDLSSGFERCFQSINESRGSQKCRKQAEGPVINFQLKPFDYAAARKKMNFGEVRDKGKAEGEESIKISKPKETNKGSALASVLGEEKPRGSQPRRRQAFPPSGNRSMTYH